MQLMNEFEYALKLDEISRSTSLTALKKLITTYYPLAEPYYKAHYASSEYSSKSSINIMTSRLYYSKLFKHAYDVYINLGGDINKLSQYAQSGLCYVTVKMPLQQAYDWVVANQETT